MPTPESNSGCVLISGGIILTPHSTYTDYTLVAGHKKLLALEPGTVACGPRDQVINARGMWVVPGMIDVHIHGAIGYDMMDANPETIPAISRFLVRHGVTSYLPTTMSAPSAAITAAIENFKNAAFPDDGAQPLGLHLEGPYLAVEHRGAQSAEMLRDPDPAEYERWFASGAVRLVSIAPERKGALDCIRQGVSRGIRFSVAHSGASYETTEQAVELGLNEGTHVFNGMVGLHHRNPGTVGAILSDDRIYAQVIADGIHLHPAVLKLLMRAKGRSRTILITDAIRAAGMQDGKYESGGQVITVQDGVVRTVSGGLAGSTLTMDCALRNSIVFGDLPFEQALQMATSTPAEALGLKDKGVLTPGADADVVLLDPELRVRLTLVGGKVVYEDMPSGPTWAH